jgi:phage shock protein PspC (stress-responsive transcriptional regulator)
LADYFGTDVRGVRLAFVLLAFAGVGAALYAVLWALMPPSSTRRLV